MDVLVMQYPRLTSYALLAVNNNRAKAYLQTLAKHGYVPSDIIYLEEENTVLVEQTANDSKLFKGLGQSHIQNCPEVDLSFDEKEHVLSTAEAYGVKVHSVSTLNVHDEKVLRSIESLDVDYLIYSGPGAVILKQEILSFGKIFLHAHPGVLPEHKGSTTFYYSNLIDSTIGCSVFPMEKDIDNGPAFLINKYEVKVTRDFDYIFDPLVRARTMLDFFEKFYNSEPKPLPAKEERGNHFYIIHPVLKHISLLSLDQK